MTQQEIDGKTIGARECASKFGWHNEEMILINLYKKLLSRDAEKQA